VQEDAQAAIPSSIGAYWRARWDGITGSEAVKDAAPLVSSAVNVAIAGTDLHSSTSQPNLSRFCP
jgi:hypothetical protein